MDDCFLPASVLGPVECCAFALLVSILDGVAMPLYSSGGSLGWAGGNGMWLIGGELRCRDSRNFYGDSAPCGHGSVEIYRWQRMAPPHKVSGLSPGWTDSQSVRRLATCPTTDDGFHLLSERQLGASVMGIWAHADLLT